MAYPRRQHYEITDIQLQPSEMYFSQEYISNTFQGGGLIGELLDNLMNGNTRIEFIRKMRVTRRGNRYFSLDNRRLWVYRYYQKLYQNKYPYFFLRVPVELWDWVDVQNEKKFNSMNGGVTVKIYNNRNPGGVYHTLVDNIHPNSYTKPGVAILWMLMRLCGSLMGFFVNSIWALLNRIIA
ncbi:unnamed protein product [Mytilus coruscus]|uniref:Uncharacterized protein n=1 Tax=Mytilus coruscus TaxID=42192 RepID=A0A6J8DT92_MYTCO|nr:unnamed protein product [Mytilus coruscus]